MLNLSARLIRRWDRMLPPISDPDACRPWTGRCDDKGYGIADAFAVTQACISSVVTGRTWAHVVTVPQLHRTALAKVAWPADVEAVTA